MQIQSNIFFFCIRCMISLIREIQLNARREGDGRREGSRGSSRMRLMCLARQLALSADFSVT